jgi:hypothetical protein
VTTADIAAGTRSPVVFPAYVHGAGPLDPAGIRSIHEMLAPVTRAMDAAGMTAGGLAVTAGPHGLQVSRPDRADDDPGRAKLAFARNVLRSRLTAEGTLWQAPDSTLLCLLSPAGKPGTCKALAVTLFGDEEPGLLIDTFARHAATVQALPLPGAGS